MTVYTDAKRDIEHLRNDSSVSISERISPSVATKDDGGEWIASVGVESLWSCGNIFERFGIRAVDNHVRPSTDGDCLNQ